MLTIFGAALMAIFWGVCVPALFLPLTALFAERSRRSQAVIFVVLTLSTFAISHAFAILAVDLTGPTIDSIVVSLLAMSLIGGAALIHRKGADRAACELANALAPSVRIAGKLTGTFVFAMALVQFLVVVLRYVFGWNSIFLQESVTYFHGATFLLAVGYAFLTNDHVRVDILYSKASLRRRAAIDLIGIYLFLFPFALLLVAMAAPYVANSWSAREGSAEQSGIQAIFLLKSLIPIFALLLAGAGFVAATDAAGVIRKETTGASSQRATA
ncbi:MAG: TRAP transporter small permease subunit [Alphaproteobacteria bacterium]|nr:TRAP transporter small permease subunit [Alphaproteobacteria bacterium]